MPVTGWLRGTVKAVPSGDTVLIVANAGPTVRFRTLSHISLFCVLFFGVALFSGEDHRRERPSKQIGRVMFLFLSLLCSHSFALACERIETIVSYSLLIRCSLFSNALSRCNDNNNTIKQSSGPPPEKIVTLAGIIAPRMVRKFLVTFFTRA